MRLTQDSSQWLQLFEFEVNKGEELGGAIPVAVTNDGQDAGVVCDRTVSTTFTATDAGYVEYQLIHGQKVDEITVLFQGTESEAEKPAVEIQTDGEWVKVGELNENPAKFDVSAYTNVTAVKVSWNAENIPTIMEIMEKGDAYAEPNRVSLYEAVATAEGLSQDDFTEDEWAAIQEALTAAKAELNGESTQEAVDAADTALKVAMGEIEPTAHTLTVKFTTNAQLDDSDAILANLTGTYTEELFPGDAYAFRFVPRVDGREFAAITVDGEEVLFDDTTDTAAYVCEGTMGYTGKTVTISFVVVDKQVLRQSITIAEELMAGEEFEAAVPSVQKAIQKAYDAAVAVEADKTAVQAEINGAWSELLDALQLLSFEAGDKTLLGELLDQANLIQEGGYTESSWDAFTEAREQAQEVYDDPDALEQDVQDAYDALIDAIDGLAFAGDLSGLQMLVDEAHEIEANLDKYLDLDNDDFKTFRDALARAEEVLAMTTPEQAVIDEAAIALSNAMSAMRLIPDKEELANPWARRKRSTAASSRAEASPSWIEPSVKRSRS